MSKTVETKQGEKKTMTIRLLRAAIIDNVRRQRGWEGEVNANVNLPSDYYCIVAQEKTVRKTKAEEKS